MVVPRLDEYGNKYPIAKLRREDGILEIALHSSRTDLIWNAGVHEQVTYLLGDVAADPGNKVVILTGTGDTFIHHHRPDPANPYPVPNMTRIHYNVTKMILNHLDVQAPMIAAINGPATTHAELGLLCDIVLAADTATFQDGAHFANGVVPGDSVQVIWPRLLGFNRARYFLWTGQVLSAAEALQLGVVNEVLNREALLPRAWELARLLAVKPEMARRFTRQALLQDLKRATLDNVPLGMSLEALALMEHMPSGFNEPLAISSSEEHARSEES